MTTYLFVSKMKKLLFLAEDIFRLGEVILKLSRDTLHAKKKKECGVSLRQNTFESFLLYHIMNIAVLNPCFFTNGQLKRLHDCGKVFIYHDTDSERKAIRRLRGIDIAIANGLFAPLNNRVLREAKNLRLLVINSTGFDFVDINTAQAMGIKVANVPGFSTEAVAEHTFALILSVLRKIPSGDMEMRKNIFEINPERKHSRKYLGTTLQGKTLGIIGLGTIGQRVAELGMAFGMNVIAYNRTKKHVRHIKMATLEEVLKKSNVLSFHLALTPDTENIISKHEFKLIRPGAIIINTARGKLIDTRALIKSLKSKKIAGAGLDVVESFDENISLAKSIAGFDNVVLTPHIAWWTTESLEKQSEIIVQNVEAFIKGKSRNTVS